MDILTKKTKKGWKAWMADNKKVCETGMSEAEAVGNLIIAAADFFGITVLNEDDD